MSIIKLLSKKIKRILFTTPSHNQQPMFSQKYSDFYEDDYSEIEGFDNLSNPKHAIMIAQSRASEIFGTKQTFFITQGSTCAILAAIKTIVNPSDRVLIARNCHKSVYNALILAAGIVDWFMPETDEDWDIYTHLDTEKIESTLKINSYKALIITSPTYEGINSDIEKIAYICKQYGVYLIVDEAHGSLYNFSNKLPKTAIQQGADISINSLHKTAGALNQTALLHISKNIQNYEIDDFQKSINVFHTTSPSYPLLSNIEACIDFLSSEKGKNEIDTLISEIEQFKTGLDRYGIEFYNSPLHDITKILLRKQGISGEELSDTIFENYSIEDELCNKISCLYLTGIGTHKAKLDKLKNALIKVKTNPSYEFSKADFQPYPIVKLQPIQAFRRKSVYVNKEEALLKISDSLILPYPPGIGILYPGEAIQKWHLDYLDKDVKIIT